MLQDSIEGILSSTSDADAVWTQLAELGMLGLTISEADDGAGLGLAELLLFAHGFGQAGVSTHYLGAEILAMPLLAAQSSHPAVAGLLADCVAGTRIATLALDDLAPVTATRAAGGGFVISGVKTLVPSGSKAGIIVLSASLDDAPALFVLDTETDGITRVPYEPAASGAGADVVFDAVGVDEAALLAKGDEADRLIADARARGLLAVCADMLGCMEKLLDLTVDYLRTRQQFGQPLASFQVLQHAAVDMYVELETARAMLDYGVRLYDAPQNERAHALDAVKFKLNAAAKTVGESAVQLHGGIGMTMESLTGRLFARLTADRLSFGDSRACLARLVANDASIALS
ncbi:acyl-CoA dehydrogenase [Oricola sp.]|uniref:acyl-CoA dehydrogenase family protein n=1 Tax=Oricola sp. TaxID=1979950 RepID=UPI0025F7E67A|nr:acyl-CoA dehydrogenase [Oricola sp.]